MTQFRDALLLIGLLVLGAVRLAHADDCTTPAAVIEQLVSSGVEQFGRAPDVSFYHNADDVKALLGATVLAAAANANTVPDSVRAVLPADTVIAVSEPNAAGNFLVFARGNCALGGAMLVEPLFTKLLASLAKNHT